MGQFEFISGKLNAMQRFMHANFDAIDKRFDAMDKRFDKIESDVGTLREDLPGVVVEAVRSVLRPGSPRRCRLGDPFLRPANQVRACPLAFSLNGFTALSRTRSRRGKPPCPLRLPALSSPGDRVSSARAGGGDTRADDELLAARASSDEESAPLALRHREPPIVTKQSARRMNATEKHQCKTGAAAVRTAPAPCSRSPRCAASRSRIASLRRDRARRS